MNRFRCFAAHVAIGTLAATALLAPPAASAVNPATTDLIALDKTTKTGLLDARVEFYPPPDPKGNAGTPKVFPAQLLFSRTNQFKLVMRAGAKDEYRAAANNGIVSWIDMGTGIGGQSKFETIMDPFTGAMLGVVGAITRFASVKELAVAPNSPVRGATLKTKTYGSSVIASKAWFSNDKLVGFEFLLSDNSRVFVSVLSFKPNVVVKPGDFTL